MKQIGILLLLLLGQSSFAQIGAIKDVGGVLYTRPVSSTAFTASASGGATLDSTAYLPAPSMHSTKPVGLVAPGAPFIVTGTAPVSTSAPAVAEHGRTAGPDEYIMASGDLVNARWLIYNGTTLLPSVSSTRKAQLSMVKMPQNYPGWGVYILWPGNSAGYGKPIIINRAEAKWMSSTVTAGMTASVYGKNLATGNVEGETNSNVYMQATSGGSFTSCVVSEVNPYRVQFTVPSVSPGTYYVWVHNASGGDYGWSERLTMTVVATQNHVLTRNWGTVTEFTTTTAVANNSTVDNAPALNTLINTVSNAGGGTIHIPGPNTWWFKNSVDLKSNVQLLGDTDASGNPSTILKTRSDFVAGSFGFTGYFQDVPMVCFKNLFFDNENNVVTRSGTSASENHFMLFFDQSMLLIDNCKIQCGSAVVGSSPASLVGGVPAYFGSPNKATKNIFIRNTTLVGHYLKMEGGRQIFLDNNKSLLRNETVSAWYFNPIQEVSLTNSSVQDYDGTKTDGTGTGEGRFVIMQGGSNWNGYYAKNTITNVGPRQAGAVSGTNFGDPNMGEIFLSEDNATTYKASPTSATSTSVTFSTAPTTTQAAPGYSNLVIIAGTGIGQERRIMTNTGSGTVGIDRAFAVIPDATSVIEIGSYTENQTVYKNTATCKFYSASIVDHNATTMVNWFGGCFNNIVADNSVTGARFGYVQFSVQRANGQHDPNMWNSFYNNRAISCRWGFQLWPDIGGTGWTLPSAGISYSDYKNNRAVSTLFTDLKVDIPRNLSIPAIVGTIWQSNTLSSDYFANRYNEEFGTTPTPVLPTTISDFLFYKSR